MARTEKFQKLLSALSRSALEQLAPKLLTTTSLPSLDNHTVNNIAALVDAETEKTMADITVETVGHLQEKLVIARGCTMRCSSGLICGHTIACSSHTWARGDRAFTKVVQQKDYRIFYHCRTIKYKL